MEQYNKIMYVMLNYENCEQLEYTKPQYIQLIIIIYIYIYIRLRWSRGSVLAYSTQVCGFKPARSPRSFRAKKSSARLPSEGK